MDNLVGQSLGSYTILERIGRGGMAEVYKALHNSLAVHRALKVILPELVVSGDFRTRFQNEAQAVANLRHQNIVQVYDFGTHGNVYYMVMEFIEGSDLKRQLAAYGRMRPLAKAVDLVLQIADALEYAHARGLIHRDIKPDNVMIAADGKPILMDFGIAKLITAETSLTRTGASIGTPAYMAPEQALGTADICPATDIYALSIVLYELLTGTVPFKADTPVGVVMKSLNEPLPDARLLCSDIGDGLQSVLVKGTAKKLQDRYVTIPEFRAALNTAVARDAASNGGTTVFSATAIRHAPSRPALRAAALGAIAIAVTGTAGFWWVKHTQEQTANDITDRPLATPAASVSDERAKGVAAAVTGIAARNEANAGQADLAASDHGTIDHTTISPTAISQTAIGDTTTGAPAARVKVDADLPAVSTNSAAPVRMHATAVTASTSLQKNELPAISAAASSVSTTSQPAAAQIVPSASVATSGPLTEVRKGVTTQSDLLRQFGGPNLTTFDEAGRETWIYERTSTQTDTVQNSQSREGSASLGLFFKSVSAGVSGDKSNATNSVSTRSTVRSITVIVKFSPDRTVYDYSVAVRGE